MWNFAKDWKKSVNLKELSKEAFNSDNMEVYDACERILQAKKSRRKQDPADWKDIKKYLDDKAALEAESKEHTEPEEEVETESNGEAKPKKERVRREKINGLSRCASFRKELKERGVTRENAKELGAKYGLKPATVNANTWRVRKELAGTWNN